MSEAKLLQYRNAYLAGLLEDTLPFWLKHSVDREQGGFMFSVDRDGSILETDKGMWQHGRFVWLLSTLVAEGVGSAEEREQWLETAEHGLRFIRRHGFDEDGRAFFQVTRDGRPLRKRRYIFTETFHAIALAAYARATGDREARDQAVALFDLLLRYLETPGLLEPKVNPAVRPMKGLVLPMILIVTAQELRRVEDDPKRCNAIIDRCIDEIERDFMKEEYRAVLETVSADGSFLDNFQGRMVCPGHSIEAGWFILEEARYRRDRGRLVALGLRIVDWMLEWGWDREYGGLLYYRDVKDRPISEYWHDMKFWWPHNEAMIATLMAYRASFDGRYLEWHEKLFDWSHAHFHDPQHGEWYGYLHRDGSVSSRLKGNVWKGPFHLPRSQLVCSQVLEEILAAG